MRWCLCLALTGCVSVDLRLTTGRGTVQVAPGHVLLEPVGEGSCPARGCCGTFPLRADGAFDPERCCGSFEITLAGRDDLTGLQWTAGAGSVLDVLDDRLGPVELSATARPVEVCYRMRSGKAPPCRLAPLNTDPLCETGLPPDDGLLELSFSETPAIDIWIEVTP